MVDAIPYTEIPLISKWEHSRKRKSHWVLMNKHYFLIESLGVAASEYGNLRNQSGNRTIRDNREFMTPDFSEFFHSKPAEFHADSGKLFL